MPKNAVRGYNSEIETSSDVNNDISQSVVEQIVRVETKSSSTKIALNVIEKYFMENSANLKKLAEQSIPQQAKEIYDTLETAKLKELGAAAVKDNIKYRYNSKNRWLWFRNAYIKFANANNHSFQLKKGTRAQSIKVYRKCRS